MEKPVMIQQRSRRCVNCNEPLTHFIAYLPGEGEACLKCYVEYAKSRGTINYVSDRE